MNSTDMGAMMAPEICITGDAATSTTRQVVRGRSPAKYNTHSMQREMAEGQQAVSQSAKGLILHDTGVTHENCQCCGAAPTQNYKHHTKFDRPLYQTHPATAVGC